MQAKPRFLLLLSFSLMVFSWMTSCKNTFDINAKWKEIVVIYGLLDATDTVQFIRVEKAYLDPKTGALDVAKISDSLHLDTADVRLTYWNGSGWSYFDKLIPVTYIPKNPGIFATDNNQLYKTNKKLDSSLEYRIEVRNPLTGTFTSAKTPLVQPASIQNPVRNTNSKFSIIPDYINVSWTPKNNSYAYDVKLKLYYDEFPKTDTNAKVSKTIVWDMITNFPVTPNVEARQLVPRLGFLQFLSSFITKDKNLNHRLKYIDMTWYGGSQSLVDFISVNQPSIGIIQKTAEFTNVENGYGLFGSRCIQSVRNVKIDPVSLQYIIKNAETAALNIIP